MLHRLANETKNGRKNVCSLTETWYFVGKRETGTPPSHLPVNFAQIAWYLADLLPCFPPNELDDDFVQVTRHLFVFLTCRQPLFRKVSTWPSVRKVEC